MPWLLVALFVLGAALPAAAHQVSESYLVVEVGERGLAGQCEVAVRDIAYVLGPRPQPGAAVAPVEGPPPSDEKIAGYVLPRLLLAAQGQALPLRVTSVSLEERRGLPYAVV